MKEAQPTTSMPRDAAPCVKPGLRAGSVAGARQKDTLIHVITDFTSAEGAQTMLARLLRSSTCRRVVVISLIGVSSQMRRLVDNPKVEFNELDMHSAFAIPAALSRLIAIVRAEQPRAMLCWMYHAMAAGAIAGRLTATPFYWTVRQALEDPAAFTRGTRMALSACRLMARSPAGIIYNSARSKTQHERCGYANSNSVVIPNGFELPSRARQMSAGPARIFGIAGRFHPQKDYPVFFKAAALATRERPELRFHVAGKGMTPDNPEVRGLMAAAGVGADRVELMGQLDDMARFYREIDVLVLSSRTEGFPNVVAEAMSYGKPVVATDVGDAADIVGETGVVCAPGDATALAKGIVDFANASPRTYRGKAEAARRRIEENYSLPRIFDAYHRFLDA